MPRLAKSALILFFGGHFLILWTTVYKWNHSSAKRKASSKHHKVYDPGIARDANDSTLPVLSVTDVRRKDEFDYGVASTMETERSRPTAVQIKNTSEPLKAILYWNAFFTAEDFKFGYGREPFLSNGCPVSSCRTTKDRTELARAEAVMVHMPVVNPAPPNPLPGQKFVFVQGEPNHQMSKWLMPDFHDLFNLTLSYRHDSDIPTKYGYLKPDPEQAWDSWVEPRERPHAAVWVVSHCETPALRELYVTELKKYMDVHVYGACGEHSCPKNKNPECRTMYERQYRFYLALENSVCQDYVTEKLYHALKYNIVPVVFGGAEYSKVAPPHSVIDIEDYPNPRNLAKYLQYLTDNATAYNEYFQWKRPGYSIETSQRVIMGRAMCRLCQILHQNDYPYRDYSDIGAWWLDDACDRRAIKRMMKEW